MKCSTRWWNAGRYEAECAAFDAVAPLSREIWEALRRFERERWHDLACAPYIVEPKDSLLLRESARDLWEDFANRIMRDHLERMRAERSPVFDV